MLLYPSTSSVAYNNYLLFQFVKTAKSNGWGQSYGWYSNNTTNTAKIWGYSKYGVAGIAKKAGTVGAFAIPIGMDYYENYQNNAGWSEYVADGAVDTVVAGGTIWATTALSAKIGAACGVEGGPPGMLIGAGVGAVVGVITGLTMDGVQVKEDQSVKQWMQDGVKQGIDYMIK